MDQGNVFSYENVVAEGSHCVIDFDPGLYAEARNLYPLVASQIDCQFSYINLNMILTKKHLYESAKKDLENYTGFNVTNNVFSAIHNKFYIRNHMFSVDVCVADKNTGVSVAIPIEELYLHTESAFYSKKRTPSMVLFVDHSTSTGIFTRGGKINLVGGYTQDEVKYALCMFLGRIEAGIRKLFRNDDLQLSILDTKLENYVVSSKIPYAKIDIYGASKYLDSVGVTKIYTPEHHNLLNIIPFPWSAPSIHVRVFPTGGIIVAGCKTIYEISIATQFLVSAIRDHIVRKWPEGCSQSVALARWFVDREMKTYSRELMKLHQMQRKRLKWELHKHAQLGTGAVKSWIFNQKPLPVTNSLYLNGVRKTFDVPASADITQLKPKQARSRHGDQGTDSENADTGSRKRRKKKRSREHD